MTERAAGITDLINQVEAMAYELSKSRDENDCDLAGAWSSLAKRSGQELSAITAAMSERDAEIERLRSAIRRVIEGKWSPTGLQEILGDLNQQPGDAGEE